MVRRDRELALSAALDLIGFKRSKLYGLIRQGHIRAVKIDATTFIDMQSGYALFAKALEIAPVEHRRTVTAQQLGFRAEPADPLADLHLRPSRWFA
jgi:hypothetical protein